MYLYVCCQCAEFMLLCVCMLGLMIDLDDNLIAGGGSC